MLSCKSIQVMCIFITSLVYARGQLVLNGCGSPTYQTAEISLCEFQCQARHDCARGIMLSYYLSNTN